MVLTTPYLAQCLLKQMGPAYAIGVIRTNVPHNLMQSKEDGHQNGRAIPNMREFFLHLIPFIDIVDSLGPIDMINEETGRR